MVVWCAAPCLVWRGVRCALCVVRCTRCVPCLVGGVCGGGVWTALVHHEQLARRLGSCTGLHKRPKWCCRALQMRPLPLRMRRGPALDGKRPLLRKRPCLLMRRGQWGTLPRMQPLPPASFERPARMMCSMWVVQSSLWALRLA